MGLPDRFRYYFYPVGQGLFCSGSIFSNSESVPHFFWVYDCGSSSSQSLISRSIENLDVQSKGSKRIDLLTISHFDHDHISGICGLLEEFHVGTLMLPYMHLGQRLLLAFEEGYGNPDNPLIDLFIDPISYLLSFANEGIDRIILVPPSGPEGPIFTNFNNDADLFPHLDGPRSGLSFFSDKPMDRETAELVSRVTENYATELHFLRPGSALNYRSLWEFIPYNDDPDILIDPEFGEKVLYEKSRLLAGASRKSRNNALKRLKRVYDDVFGADSEGRNLISLFLYAGPIYANWQNAEISGAIHWRTSPPQWREFPFHSATSRCSIVYTGDGYLDTSERLERLVRYLNEARVEKTAIFQVMHHGAEGNWHKGVADRFRPSISVFSSDPMRKKWQHPHSSVLRDFWHYSPVQVDKEWSFLSLGTLEAFI